MKDTKQKTASLTITFYVFAVILLLIFAFMSWFIFDSIKAAMTQYGMSFSEFWGEMWQNVINMFATQSFPFLVYAFICYGIGYLINEAQSIRFSLKADLVTNCSNEEHPCAAKTDEEESMQETACESPQCEEADALTEDKESAPSEPTQDEVGAKQSEQPVEKAPLSIEEPIGISQPNVNDALNEQES